eukprot:gene14119-30051_t
MGLSLRDIRNPEIVVNSNKNPTSWFRTLCNFDNLSRSRSAWTCWFSKVVFPERRTTLITSWKCCTYGYHHYTLVDKAVIWLPIGWIVPDWISQKQLTIELLEPSVNYSTYPG